MLKKKSLSGALNVLDALNQKKTLDDYMSSTENKNTSQTKSAISSSTSNEYTIHSLDPDVISRWEYKDRPDNELGDIDALANELKAIGQQQPCIVRPIRGQNNYELIVGERRWLASKKAKINIKVIIQEIDDNTAALIQAAENDSRKDLSDYAKGMSLSRLIKNGVIKQKDLEDKLGKSKQEVSRLLSFSRIEESVFTAIETFSDISARTAYEISRLSNKGEKHVDALISISQQIRTGKYGANKIVIEVNKIMSTVIKDNTYNTKVIDNEGRHLFSWRIDNNKQPSLHFPKSIVDMIEANKINIEVLTTGIKNELSKQIKS
jgi:ParB family chromosome partitioning protein